MHPTLIHTPPHSHAYTHAKHTPLQPPSPQGLTAEARGPRVPRPPAPAWGAAGTGSSKRGRCPRRCSGFRAACLLSALSERIVQTSASCSSRESQETPAAAGKTDTDPPTAPSCTGCGRAGRAGGYSPGEAGSAPPPRNETSVPTFPAGLREVGGLLKVCELLPDTTRPHMRPGEAG